MLNPIETFEQIWNESPIAARLVNQTGHIVGCNQAYCNMVELPPSKLKDKKLTIVYQANMRRKMFNTFTKAMLANKLPQTELLKLRLWNGRKIWMDILHSPFPAQANEKYTLSIVRDVTKARNAEKKLRISEQRFRILFDHANDAIFVNHMTARQKLGTFIEVNDIACRKLLYSKEEYSHLNPYSIIPYDYYKKMDMALARLETTKETIFQIELLRKDKQRIPVEINARIFTLDGQDTLVCIARNISQRKLVENQLKSTSDRLRDLALRIQDIREEERAMIAREIHDELGQVLTVLKIQLSLTTNKLYPDQLDLKNKLESTFGLLDRAVEAVQQISAKLRPGILDELGLVAAIEWQAQDFEKRTGITCKCSLIEEALELSVERSTALFRIFQEALTNVARHANAERVSIFFKIHEQQLVLEITDNGNGINKSQINSPKSLGLLGMRERAMVFGGDVSINGVLDKGTHVKVTMPLVEEKI